MPCILQIHELSEKGKIDLITRLYIWDEFRGIRLIYNGSYESKNRRFKSVLVQRSGIAERAV